MTELKITIYRSLLVSLVSYPSVGPSNYSILCTYFRKYQNVCSLRWMRNKKSFIYPIVLTYSFISYFVCMFNNINQDINRFLKFYCIECNLIEWIDISALVMKLNTIQWILPLQLDKIFI